MFLRSRFFFLASLLLPTGWAVAETFFVEDFDYANGDLAAVSGGEWSIPAVNAANPEADVVDGALVLDWNIPATDPVANGYYTRVFSTNRLSEGFLYARFTLRPLVAPSAGTASGASVNVAAFWNNGSGFRGNLWYGLAVDGSDNAIAGHVRFGLTDGQGSRSAIIWDTQAFPLNEAVEVVLRYDLTNGVARLYLNPQDVDDYVAEVNDRSTLTIGGFGFRLKDDRPGVEGGSLSIDDLSISDQFEVQVIVEEPPSELAAFPLPEGAIGLTWRDNSVAETGFLIESRVGDVGAFSTVGVVPANTTSYRVTGDAVGVGRVYRVSLEGQPSVGYSEIVGADPDAMAPSDLSVAPAVNAAGGAVAVGVEARRGVSYTAWRSADLVTWEIFGAPLGFGASTIIPVLGSEPAFFRFSAEALPTPSEAGLTKPFVLPQTGGGRTLSAADQGMTPSTTTDQAPALRNALLYARDGDTVMVPEGDYYMASQVRVPSGVILRGSADGVTRFLVEDGLEEFLFVAPNAEDVEILDFSITAAGETFINAVTVNDRYETLLVRRVRIAGLTIDKFSSRAISVRNAEHVLVENNTISDATALGGGGQGYGIELRDDENQDNWVRGNTIGPVIRHAVLLQYRAHNNLVEGNVAIDTVEDAYDLHGEDEYLNEFRGNLAYWRDPIAAQSISAGGFGVGNPGATHVDTGPGNWIHHNEVYNYSYGADVQLGSHHNYIDGNYFHDLRIAGIRVTNGGGDFLNLRGNLLVDSSVGISAENADYLVIEGNRFVDNAQGGVRLATDSTDYRIEHNDFTAQTTKPLDLGSDDGTVGDNSGIDP